jgi:hypothetical protein
MNPTIERAATMPSRAGIVPAREDIGGTSSTDAVRREGGSSRVVAA